MEQFYTKTVSDNLTKELKKLGFPIVTADMGFTLPQIVDLNPMYAEVLDWLKNQDIEINMIYTPEKINTFEVINTGQQAIGSNFEQLIEKTIFLALEFIDNDLENR